MLIRSVVFHSRFKRIAWNIFRLDSLHIAKELADSWKLFLGDLKLWICCIFWLSQFLMIFLITSVPVVLHWKNDRVLLSSAPLSLTFSLAGQGLWLLGGIWNYCICWEDLHTECFEFRIIKDGSFGFGDLRVWLSVLMKTVSDFFRFFASGQSPQRVEVRYPTGTLQISDHW